MLYQIKRPIYMLVLLLAVALAVGCTTSSLEVVFDPALGSVEGIPENADQIDKGTLIELTAVPNEGYLFSSWKGVPDSMEKDNPLKLELDKDRTVEALFSEFLYEMGFERGLGGWTSANAQVDVTKDIARTGNFSAKITLTDGQGWNRLGLNMVDLLEKDKAYQISMWVYHEAGEPRDIHIVRKVGDTYNWISEGGNISVPSGEWVEIPAVYDLSQESMDIGDELLIFIECNVKEIVYYVDDISVKPVVVK